MDTLLIQLVGPMQSWGTQSNYTLRDTALEPSKSGVIGILCAALGRPREAALDDLTGLRMGVRVDREGKLERDFQVVQDVLNSSGTGTRDTIVTERFYLADAGFLVGLEGNVTILEKVQSALQKPKWQIFLGRKAFPPTLPVYIPAGLREGENLEKALANYADFVAPPRDSSGSINIRMVIEDENGSSVRRDVPLSFRERTFSTRKVSVQYRLFAQQVREVQ